MAFNSNGSAPSEDEDEDDYEDYDSEVVPQLDCDGDGVADPHTDDACWIVKPGGYRESKKICREDGECASYGEDGRVYYSGCYWDPICDKNEE